MKRCAPGDSEAVTKNLNIDSAPVRSRPLIVIGRVDPGADSPRFCAHRGAQPSDNGELRPNNGVYGVALVTKFEIITHPSHRQLRKEPQRNESATIRRSNVLVRSLGDQLGRSSTLCVGVHGMS